MMKRFSVSTRPPASVRNLALFAALLAALLFIGAHPAAAQVAPEEESVPPVPEPLPDGTDPYIELDEALGLIDGLIARSDVSNADRSALRKARTEIEKAQQAYGNLEINLQARNTLITVRLRKASSTILRLDQHLTREVEQLTLQLTSAARLIAGRYLDHATAVGVDRSRLDRAAVQLALGDTEAAAGLPDQAIGDYGNILKIVGPDLTFNMDLFEQGIRDRFDGQVVGMAYVITNKGALAREFASGLARLPNEPGNNGIYLFSVDTEMMVASVSKNITAVGVMRMLQENGLSPDDSVAPYFPSYWDVDESIQDLTFRDLMTHSSGLNGYTGQAGTTRCASSYLGLKSCIEAGVDPADKVWAYQNANFGIFRVILSYMEYESEIEAALDLIDCNQSAVAEAACDSTFEAYMGERFERLMRCKVFDKMKLGDPGVAGCNDGPSTAAEDLPQTLMYSVPGVVENGYAPDDHTLDAGGFGWYFSARELAQFQAYRRYSNAVLSQKTRSLMDNGYLGWMTPGQYGSWTSGLFGTYRLHGGDWLKDGNKELHTCVVDFTQGIQVSLIINSNTGAGPYQCNALKLAYDAAWVAK